MNHKSIAQRSPSPRPRWKSMEQLSDIWGLSRARTRLIVEALVRSGRMEERAGQLEAPSARHQYRVTRR
jgi:DNA-binding transcriptional MocR family regulator